jgi:methyltransferase
MDTRLLYTGLVVLVALQRLIELAVSKRNERRLRARGAVEAGAAHYPWMVALHTAFLVSCLAEVWLLPRPFVAPLAAVALAVLAAASALRVWTLSTLGERWSARVLVLTGAPPVVGGPYRHLRHPNYLAVVLEIAALPLVHTAWLTALVFTVANAVLLRVRIGVEEAALSAAASGDSSYARAFAGRPRLLPGAGSRAAGRGDR